MGSSVATVAVTWLASTVVGVGPYADNCGTELELIDASVLLLALLAEADADVLAPDATGSGIGRKPTRGACSPLMP